MWQDGFGRARITMRIKQMKLADRTIQTSMDAVIEEYKKHVDLSLIRENLRLTVQQRFENLMNLQAFAEELRRAGKRADEK